MRRSRPANRWKRSLLIGGGFTVGVIAICCVIKQAGLAVIGAVVSKALPFFPFAILLEGCRIGTEVMAARSLFRALRSPVPLAPLVRAQLGGYAICNVMPVGRMASEASKAGILRSHAPLPKTAAVAAIAQALHLISSAIILIPCVLAARARSSWGLSLTIAGQCGLLATVGGTLLAVAYFAPVGGLASRRLPKIAAALEQFRSAMRQLPRFPGTALAWLVLNRALQVAIIAVLLRAVGQGWSLVGPLVAQAVLLIGSSAADVVPGQIGAMEGAFGFFANAIGATGPQAVAVALSIHLVQSLWMLVGFGALVLARPRPRQVAEPLGGTSVLSAS